MDGVSCLKAQEGVGKRTFSGMNNCHCTVCLMSASCLSFIPAIDHVTNKTVGYRNMTKTWVRPGVQTGIRTLVPLLRLCCKGPFWQCLFPSLISERMNWIFWVRETKFQKGWDMKDSCHLGPEGGDFPFRAPLLLSAAWKAGHRANSFFPGPPFTSQAEASINQAPSTP